MVAPPSRLQKDLKRYEIGPFVLDTLRLVLTCDGTPLPVGPRVVATLAALVERAGEVVTKDEMLDRVWSGEDVNESNVAQSVYVLRKLFRERGCERTIVTVPRRGYRFAGAVRALEAKRPAPVATHARTGLFVRAAAAVALIALLAVPATRGAEHAPPLSAHGAERYRLGRYYWALRTPETLAKSVRLFREVIRTDPRSPLGYSGLADAELMTVDYERGRVDVARAFAEARAAVTMALRLDPSSVAARTSLGMVRKLADRDARAAETELLHAIALDPSYALAHHWYGVVLFDRGRIAEALEQLRAAIRLDPISPSASSWLAEALYDQRRFSDAIGYSRLALELDPSRADALRALGLAYEESGKVTAAIATFERMRRIPSVMGNASALLAEAYARSGRREEARRALAVALRLEPHDKDTKIARIALGEEPKTKQVLAALRSENPYEPRLARYGS
jgi:DNA-binding winged helix-turn-helix (wHTH) protein/Flp pilus assembly protein TadD